MPESSGNDLRYISPRSIAAVVETTSSWTDAAGPPAGCTTATGPSGAHPSPSASARTSACGCTRDRRGISERMLNAMAFTVVLLAGVGLFLYQVWKRFNLLRAASGEFTLDRITERVRAVLVYAFGQEKFIRPEVGIVRERTAGWLHFFVFWGFVVLGLQIRSEERRVGKEVRTQWA